MLQEDIQRWRRSSTDLSSDINKGKSFQEDDSTPGSSANVTADTSFPDNWHHHLPNRSSTNFSSYQEQTILKNVHPTISTEKHLKDNSSRGMLLKWGSRLELEAIDLKQKAKEIVLEAELSQKEMKDLTKKLLEQLESRKQEEETTDSNHGSYQSCEKLILELSKKISDMNASNSDASYIEALTSKVTALNKTILTIKKDFENLTQLVEGLKGDSKTLEKGFKRTIDQNTKNFSLILQKLEVLEKSGSASHTDKDIKQSMPLKQMKKSKVRLKTNHPLPTRPVQTNKESLFRNTQTQVRTRAKLNMSDLNLYDIIYPSQDVFDLAKRKPSIAVQPVSQALLQPSLAQQPCEVDKRRSILEDDVEACFLSE